MELTHVLFKFCKVVKAIMDGTSDDKSFVRCSPDYYHRALKLS